MWTWTKWDGNTCAFLRSALIICLFSFHSSVLNVSPTTTYTFKLPEIHFPLVGQCVQAYYCDCVSLLSKAMSFLAPESSVLLARYFYLRGLVHLMQGQLLGALLDFQSLYKTDVRIFPADLVKRTVDSMSAPERAQAEQTPELRRLISEVMDKAGEAPKADDRVKNFELPKKHMQLDDFVKRVQESGIVKDIGTIHRLFEALTVGKSTDAQIVWFKFLRTSQWRLGTSPVARGLCHHSGHFGHRRPGRASGQLSSPGDV